MNPLLVIQASNAESPGFPEEAQASNAAFISAEGAGGPLESEAEQVSDNKRLRATQILIITFS